jgi:hypothetical protein
MIAVPFPQSSRSASDAHGEVDASTLLTFFGAVRHERPAVRRCVTAEDSFSEFEKARTKKPDFDISLRLRAFFGA